MVPYHLEFLVPLIQEDRRRHAAHLRQVEAVLAAQRQQAHHRPLRFRTLRRALTGWRRPTVMKAGKQQATSPRMFHIHS